MVVSIPALDSQLLAAFLGAVVGFLLAEISAITRERRQDHKQRNSVRAALHYEIADNLKTLAEFWPPIVKKPEGERDFEGPGGRLLNAVVPHWSTSTWRGVAPSIAVALDSDEIGKVHRLYATLAAVSDAQRRLAEVSSDDIARQAATPHHPPVIRGAPPTPGFAPAYLRETAQTLIPTLNEKIAIVLASGNPIDPRSFSIDIAPRWQVWRR